MITEKLPKAKNSKSYTPQGLLFLAFYFIVAIEVYSQNTHYYLSEGL